MTTLTVGRVAELPRVNLLPPEIAEAAKFRQLQVLLGMLVLGSLGVVAFLFILASGQVSHAQGELDTAQAQNAALQSEVAQYSDIPQVQADLAAAETNLSTAMAPEVRWSFLLNDLSLTIPSSVRLTTMTITEPLTVDPTTGLPGVTSELGTPGVGTITFDGKAASYDAVAAWLQMLAKQSGYADPTITTVAETTAEGQAGKTYDFSSSVTVTPDALSGRYLTTPGG